MILANGCNITKSEKFKGVWILSVPTVNLTHFSFHYYFIRDSVRNIKYWKVLIDDKWAHLSAPGANQSTNTDLNLAADDNHTGVIV